VPWNTAIGETLLCKADDDGYEAAVDCAVHNVCGEDRYQHGRETVDREPDRAAGQLIGSTSRPGRDDKHRAVEGPLDPRRSLRLVGEGRCPGDEDCAPDPDERDGRHDDDRPQRDCQHVPSAAGGERLADEVKDPEDDDLVDLVGGQPGKSEGNESERNRERTGYIEPCRKWQFTHQRSRT
jgi:hypothetical protein